MHTDISPRRKTTNDGYTYREHWGPWNAKAFASFFIPIQDKKEQPMGIVLSSRTETVTSGASLDSSKGQEREKAESRVRGKGTGKGRKEIRPRERYKDEKETNKGNTK
jgi:hypothetical protein